MKKFFSLLAVAFGLQVGNAQTGATCIDAIPETSNPTCIPTAYTSANAEIWFEFVATSEYVNIEVGTIDFGVDAPHIHGITLYDGSCNNLQELSHDELPFVPGAVQLRIDMDASNLVVGDTYFIQLDREASGPIVCDKGGCFPVLGNVTFGICIEEVDVFIPPDVNLEGASPTHTYYRNRGQLLFTDGTPANEVLLYSLRSTPQILVAQDYTAFLFSKTNATDTLSDTLHRVDMRLVGANAGVKVFKTEETGDVLNYFMPHIPKGVVRNKGYCRVVCNDVYTGVDMQLYSNPKGIKMYFTVAPEADGDAINLVFGGADNVSVTNGGGLKIETSLGDLEFEQAHIYRIHHVTGNIIPMPASGDFVSTGPNTFGFNIQNYPSQQRLIIAVDEGHLLPTAAANDWSTYHGAASTDRGRDVVTDGNGNVYITGIASSQLFPNTAGGAFAFVGGGDAFITSFDKDGQANGGTFFGGSGTEIANGIDIAPNGDVYIAGETLSNDMPLSPPANSALKGPKDAFIARFTNNGQTHLFSSYVGGDTTDNARDIAVDGSGNAYMVGSTDRNMGFPIVAKGGNAFDQNAAVDFIDNSYIVQFDATNTQVWGTYFARRTWITDVAIGLDNKVYITGGTINNTSAGQVTPCGVPGLPGLFPDCDPGNLAWQQAYTALIGSGNSFITEFDVTGELLWSTYWGGGGEATWIRTIDNSIAASPLDTGTVFISGSVKDALNYLVFGPSGSFQYNQAGFTPTTQAFGVKFRDRRARWSSLLSCGNLTFGDTYSYDIGIDQKENLYMVGRTSCNIPSAAATYCTDTLNNGEFPICQGNTFFQDFGTGSAQYGGGMQDGFLAAFDDNQALILSTYYGGNNNETVYGVTHDKVFNRIYLTGETQSTDSFPLLDPQTNNYQQNSKAGTATVQDAFIARFGTGAINWPLHAGEQEIGSDLIVYPNPATQYVTVAFTEGFEGKLELNLYNAHGSLITQKSINSNAGQFQLNVNGMAPGIYLIQLTDRTQARAVRLVVY